MTFLAPAWLLLGALAGIVLILNAHRRRRLQVSSVRLWHLIDSTPKRRFALQWPPLTPLLLLQLAIVAATALALAQPRLGDTRALPDHTIFVLDASASMRATDASPSRFERATAELERRIESLLTNTDGRVSLIVAGAQADLAFARQNTLTGVRSALDRVTATDGNSDWPAAFSWLDALVRSGEITDVVLLTDGADAAATEWTPARADLRVQTVLFGGGEDVGNAGLSATITRVDAAAGIWQIQGEIAWTGNAEPPAQVTVDFGPLGQTAVLASAGIPLSGTPATQDGTDIRTLPFSQSLQFPGPGHVQLSIDADAVPHDDRLHFVLENPRALRVLLLGRQDDALIRALQLIGPTQISAGDTLPAQDAAFDLIVVNDVVVPRQPNTNVLWIGRGRVQNEPEPGAATGGFVTAWRNDHPVTRSVDWSSLRTPVFYPAELAPGSTVLAEAGGLPLVAARTTAAGRELRLTLDPVLSGWTAAPSFPLLILGWIDWLGIEFGPARTAPCVAGLPCVLEARELTATVFGPDGAAVFSGPAADSAQIPPGAEYGFVPQSAGIYRIEHGGESRWLAVHPAADVYAASAALADSARGGFRWLDAWRWLALAVLALLLVEAWIAGRGGERFLSAQALARGVPHAGRRRTLLALRAVALAGILAALLSVPLPQRGPEHATVAILGTDWLAGRDDADQQQLLARVADTGAGLVAAGTHSRLLRDVAEAGAISWSDAPDELSVGADIERALRLALAMLPGDRPGRILMTTDGHATRGEMGRTLGALAGREVAVDVLPTAAAEGPEVALSRVEVPTRVHAGDSYPLRAFVHSSDETAATVTILRDGVVMNSYAVTLSAGQNLIETSLRAEEAGSSLIEVRVDAPNDGRPENNGAGTMIDVHASPRILIVTPSLQWGVYFSDMLNVQQLSGEVRLPGNSPQTLQGWLEYDLVVLMNMPALAMDIAQQQLLEEAVRVHGLGLLILGGENAFAAGGYFGTPLEDLSPLSSLLPYQSPQVAMVFVIDRSGSMSGAVAPGLNRMDITRAATRNAVELLREGSRVSVVMFDSISHIIYPLQPKNDAALAEALNRVGPGGGTNPYPGLLDAVVQLQNAPEEIRHIVLMTDGQFGVNPSYDALVSSAARNGITLSTISVGTPRDQSMANMAQAGGGVYYAVNDFQALPSIFAQETMTLANPPVVQQNTPVVWVDREAEFLSNLPTQLPPLSSYVGTTLKPAADLHLGLVQAGQLVPALASWNYGNGRVLAFASHGAGSGAQQWMQMPQYPLFWAQTIRHFLPGTIGPGLHVLLEQQGDHGIGIVANLLDADGAPLPRQAVMAILDGEQDGPAVQLAETSPGRYQGRLEVSQAGNYRVRVTTAGANQEASIHIGYPQRFDPSRVDLPAFEALASASGGQRLGGVQDLDGFAQAGTVWKLAPHWRPWMLLAIAAFMLDLLLRAGLGSSLLRRRQAGQRPGG